MKLVLCDEYICSLFERMHNNLVVCCVEWNGAVAAAIQLQSPQTNNKSKDIFAAYTSSSFILSLQPNETNAQQ